jgi:hypothetical protein
MKESDKTGRENDENEKESARTGIFKYANEYKQSNVDVPELTSMEGNGKIGNENNEDEFEGAGTGTPKHADEYG